MKARAEPKECKKRKWYSYWPFLIIVVEIVFNIDWIITPILIKRGMFFNFPIFPIHWDLSWLIPKLSYFEVFIWISSLSVPTTLGWYWLWGWLGDLIVETAKTKEAFLEAVTIWKKIIIALERGDILELVRDWFVDTFNWATDNNNKWLKYLRRGGYTALFIISALPVSGGRLVATIFCRSIDTKKGLTILILGETLKNAIMVYGFWNLIFWMLS